MTKYSSPFEFGTVVTSSAFTNREKEIKKLLGNLTQGINTIIISPRRWGKSSLVEKVVSKIESKDIKTIVIDLNKVSSKEEFLEMFAREVIKASTNKLDELVKSGQQFFKQLIPKINFGPTPDTDFSISFDWESLEKHPDEVLNLPEIIANKKQLSYIICVDEFQNIADFKDYKAFEKKIRAIWQRQNQVTYCLYGSKNHMMTEIFDHASNPFYRFGDIMHLPKIKTEKWVAFLTESFKDTGKHITHENAQYIALQMQNHSWYVQQLAHYTWQNTENEVTRAQINMALRELIAANTPFFLQLMESFTPSRLNLLKVIAKKETQYYAEKVKKRYKIGTSNLIKKNISTLEKNGILNQLEKGHEFLDPAFELWFNKHFFDKDYIV